MTDVAKMNRMMTIARNGSPLKQVLTEVSLIVPRVVSWTIVPTSGSAVCRYNAATGAVVGYEIRYQQGNIGNLVHELIHAAVNEAYGHDFVNYPNAAAAAPARTYDGVGRCTNEFARQTAFMTAAGNARVSGKLQALSSWANAATELTVQQRADITAKFNYGMQWPMKEYDTVITQVLVWLHEWGYPTLLGPGGRKPIVNALYEEVEKAVAEAYRMRLVG